MPHSLDRDEPPLAPPNVRFSPNSDQNIAAPNLVAKGQSANIGLRAIVSLLVAIAPVRALDNGCGRRSLAPSAEDVVARKCATLRFKAGHCRGGTSKGSAPRGEIVKL
jgi:hypothetical protein